MDAVIRHGEKKEKRKKSLLISVSVPHLERAPQNANLVATSNWGLNVIYLRELLTQDACEVLRISLYKSLLDSRHQAVQDIKHVRIPTHGR